MRDPLLMADRSSLIPTGRRAVDYPWVIRPTKHRQKKMRLDVTLQGRKGKS